jgi:hypothetical protein
MTLRRELSDAAVQHQARQLLDYSKRGGGVSRWLDSKDLLPGDRDAIFRAWRAMDEADDVTDKTA